MKNKYICPNKGSVCIRLERKTGYLWAIIDAADFELVSAYPGYWQARWSESAHTFYAQIRTGKNPSRFVQMHRLIMGVLKEDHLKVVIDHGDHNGLNNHRWNLESVSRAVNQIRRSGPQSNNVSGYRGVVLIKNRLTNPWRAATYKNRSTQTIGYFPSAKAAGAAVLEYLQGV